MINYPLVSIVVLTYNNFNYVNQCISSVLDQDYKNIELIISDDCSNNFNEEYIKNYIEQNKGANIVNYRVIINKQNLGTVKNFNNAIKISNGEYIVPLAIDDCFNDSNVITSIVNKFINSKSLILTAYRNVYSSYMDKFICKLPTRNEVRLIGNHSIKLYRELCKKNFISGSCIAYSRNFFEVHGFFDEDYKLLEDKPKLLQALRANERIVFLDIPIIKYRLGGISTSNNINPILQNDFYLLIQKEILTHKKEAGLFIYRLKKFEYSKNVLLKSKYILLFLYIDVVAYKIFSKLKILLFSNND